MFQTIIVQPIYNLLVAIYGILPGHDLGISLIIFTVLIRLAMWPMLKKQLHQSKIMRDLQPELKKIKKAAGGDRQKEGVLMMALYKEKGISPFGSIGLTIIQLPLFIGVFQAARQLTEHLNTLSSHTYSFVKEIPHVQTVLHNSANFNFKSLGFIDLSRRATSGGKVYIPVLVLAAAATIFQYFQSKQLLPQPKEKKRLRDIMKSSDKGSQSAQDDMTAAMTGSMLYLMPVLTLLFAIAAQGTMVMYLLASSVIGIFQQSLIFKKDTDEMEAEVVDVVKTPLNQAPVNETTSKVNRGKVVTKTRIITPGNNSTTAQKKKRKKR